MTEPIKDFDSPTSGTPAGAFRLGGRVWHVRKRADMPWTKLPSPPENATSDDEVRVYLFSLLEHFIVAGESDELLALLQSPQTPLTAEKAPELLRHITQLSLGRPTKRPSSSRGGSRGTKARSAANSSSRVTARRR